MNTRNPSNLGPVSLYLHVPFCLSRCTYCDFESMACPANDPSMQAYTADILEQLAQLKQGGFFEQGLSTAYIGGGTPSHLGDLLETLCAAIGELTEKTKSMPLQEFTVECNPESVSRMDLRALRECGVSRMSLGVQSFDDKTLKLFGRIHNGADAHRAISLIKSQGFELACDLICGAPNQTVHEVCSNIDQLVLHGVDHISVYSLSLEEGTKLAQEVLCGRVEPRCEDDVADQLEAAASCLKHHGFERYEISNYATNNAYSKHNLLYWTGGEYLGLGRGAASMMSAHRARHLLEVFDEQDPSETTILFTELTKTLCEQPNNARIRFTLRAQQADLNVESTRSLFAEAEILSYKDSLLEDTMLRLRLSEGVPESMFDELCHLDPLLKGRVTQTLERWVNQGLVCQIVKEGRKWIVPTNRGWLLGNELFGDVWMWADDR